MEPLSVQGGARHDCCSASAIAAPVAHSVRACQHRLPHALAQTPGDRREANRRALQLHGAGWSAEGPTHPLSPQRVGASPKSLLNPAPPGQCSRAAHILGRGKRAAPTPLPCQNQPSTPAATTAACARSISPWQWPLSFPIDRSAGAAVMAPASMPPSAAKTAEQRSPRGVGAAKAQIPPHCLPVWIALRRVADG